MGINSNF